MKLFSVSAPLECVKTDVLGELIGKLRGNMYILVITDRMKNLIKTIPMITESAELVVRNLIDEWVFNYGPPVELISENCILFRS